MKKVWSKEFAQSPDNPFFLRETARYFRVIKSAILPLLEIGNLLLLIPLAR